MRYNWDTIAKKKPYKAFKNNLDYKLKLVIILTLQYMMQYLIFMLLGLQIFSIDYPKSRHTLSELPSHASPKNFDRIPIEFRKNSNRIPKEFLKNFQRISKEFPKNFHKVLNKFQKNSKKFQKKFQNNSKKLLPNYQTFLIALWVRNPFRACLVFKKIVFSLCT